MDKDNGLIEDEYLAFFRFFYAFYKKAERNLGEIQDRFFNIGNRPVRLHFVGKGLVSCLNSGSGTSGNSANRPAKIDRFFMG